jgi:hypothetical protein
VAAACSTVFAIIAPLFGRWWLTAAAFALATVLALSVVGRRPAIAPWVLATLVATVLAVAVIVPPQGSHDIWSYAIVGRTVAAHHLNPYIHAPRDFPDDPLLSRVGWRNTTTPYGPVFVGYAATVARITGAHPTRERFGFQLIAACSVALACWLLWRFTRSAAAVLLLALHPVVAASMVNGGHNDAVVGLAILGAVLLARADRFGQSGLALAAAMLIKLTAGLALLPLAAWIGVRRGSHAVRWFAIAALGTTAALTLLAPGAFGSIAHADAGVVSRGSVWNVMLRVRAWLVPGFGGSSFASVLSKIAVLLVIGVAVVAAVRARHAGRKIARDVAAATAGWLFVGAYTLPWYAGWSLPVAASQPTSAMTTLIAAEGGFLAMSMTIPLRVLRNNPLVGSIVHVAVPAVMLALFLMLLTSERRAPGAQPMALAAGADDAGLAA